MILECVLWFGLYFGCYILTGQCHAMSDFCSILPLFMSQSEDISWKCAPWKTNSNCCCINAWYIISIFFWEICILPLCTPSIQGHVGNTPLHSLYPQSCGEHPCASHPSALPLSKVMWGTLLRIPPPLQPSLSLRKEMFSKAFLCSRTIQYFICLHLSTVVVAGLCFPKFSELWHP